MSATPEESALDLIFSPGGLLSRCLPSYEERPEQRNMARFVWNCLADGTHGLVEAGTGVGKSLAYLFPAAMWALTAGERLVISTHTINLQEQLIRKDIPIVRQVLAELGAPELGAVLVKGRANYLCRRRLEEERQRREEQTGFWAITNETDEAVRQLAAWAGREDCSGDRSECPFPVPAELWSQLQSDADECAGEKCKHREECLYRRARRQQEKAQLMVTNHALLLTDIKLRADTDGQGVLLPYEGLVVDEAHHLERVASEYLGVRLSVHRFLSLASSVEHLLSQPAVQSSLSPQSADRYRQSLAALTQTATSFFSGVAAGVTTRPVRLRNPLTGQEPLARELDRLADALRQLAEAGISDECSHLAARQAGRCRSLREELLHVAAVDDREQAYWLEPVGTGRANRVILCSAPTQVAESLQQHLFARLRSVVLTSATLAVGGHFQYIGETLGVPDPRELVLGSPFDYREQALLCVPEDARLVGPDQPGYPEYVAAKILEIVKTTSGRAFVLFTSYQTLNQVYQRVEGELREQGMQPLRQGDASRESLLEAFSSSPAPVLFGVDSFWEGVDVPGEALSCVIITRLPFEVPDEPLVQARCERLRHLGKDPFWHYTLPRAAIKLKQGFGRLIRTRQDRGAVVILDHRLATRRYGRFLWQAMPPTRTSTDLTELAAAVNPPGHGRNYGHGQGCTRTAPTPGGADVPPRDR